MTNKVAHMLAKSFNDAGAIAVRFNYRGVGMSEGHYDEGNGETADALAVLEWTRHEWPGTELWLGGFSFGGAVAIRAAHSGDVRRLVTVAPAVDRVPVATMALPRCPWLIVQGDLDDVVDPRQVERWRAALPSPPELAVLPGAEHFFHGKLTELRRVVVEWLRRQHAEA
jgi:alpha/beta superfamily hydrolase